MNSLREIPEIAALRASGHIVRIPPELDVPLTPRVRQLMDSPEFRRLARISQLGLVSLVYPAANHTRHEHSLGVYRMALLYLDRLAEDERFVAAVSPQAAERFVMAALLHDLGHWPFCHPIEDLQLRQTPTHELFANSFLLEGELADLLRDEWDVQPREIVDLLSGKPKDRCDRLLRSMLSGPIDVDKMDYLMRDSLHAGVPYGRNFDQPRLIQSLCLSEAGDRLAITDKGKTAAEMMVFARYVMFSEVYWHHAVRSATAMLQRAFFRAASAPGSRCAVPAHRAADDRRLARCGGRRAGGGVARRVVRPDATAVQARGAVQFVPAAGALSSASRGGRMHGSCGARERFAAIASTVLGRVVAPHEVLFDAPPVKLEVEFQIEVHYPKEGCYRQLGDVSPVVKTLARQQFDDYVKRVRVFAHPRVAGDLRALNNVPELLAEAVDEAG